MVVKSLANKGVKDSLDASEVVFNGSGIPVRACFCEIFHRFVCLRDVHCYSIQIEAEMTFKWHKWNEWENQCSAHWGIVTTTRPDNSCMKDMNLLHCFVHFLFYLDTRHLELSLFSVTPFCSFSASVNSLMGLTCVSLFLPPSCAHKPGLSSSCCQFVWSL